MADLEFSDLEQQQIRLASLLVEQINQSIKIANESKVCGTRVSRMRAAVDKLAELQSLAMAYPFLKLQRLDDVLVTIETIKRETREQFPDWAAVESARQCGDVVRGLRFHATLQLRTPLSVLKHHGALHTDLESAPPRHARELWHGHWAIETKSWEELGGVAGPDLSPTTVATDLGPMDDRGEAYYRFLLAIRTIAADRRKPMAQRRAEVADACERLEWVGFAAGHGGSGSVSMKLFLT